ncbi:MAG TPA: hypothetical protein VKV06_01070 [Acidimicrobiales bacterium]|nr:hypothetical protein [Acidimicrobiales bacterium]
MPSYRRWLLAVVVVVATVVALAQPAAAAFTSGTTAKTSLGAATLSAPTGVTVSTHCNSSAGGSTATLTWTPATSTVATQSVTDLSASGGSPTAVGSTVPAGTTSATVSITNKVTYTASVGSVYLSWTSPLSTPSSSFSCK